MTSAVAVEPEVARAVHEGRQVVLLHVDPPTDRDGFWIVPTGDDPEIATWCDLVGLVTVDDDRIEAVAGAGLWSPKQVRSMLDDHPGLTVSFVRPRRLAEPVAHGAVAVDPGRIVDLEVDLNVDATEPVLDEDELKKRHDLIKVALGLIV